MKKLLFCLTLFAGLICQAQNRLFPYYNGKKWGLTNENLDVVISPRFDSIFYFGSNNYSIVLKGKKLGITDKTGKMLAPFQYDQIYNLNGIMGSGKINGKYALLDLRTGKQTVPVLFDRINDYCYCAPDIFTVTQGTKRGFVNTKTGKIIGRIVYDNARFMQDLNMRGMISTGRKSGLINLRNGNIILPVKFDDIGTEYLNHKQVIIAFDAGNKKFYDSDGKEIIKPREAGGDESVSIGIMEGESTGIIAPPVIDELYSTDNRNLYIYNQGNDTWKLSIEKRSHNGTEIIETAELSGYTSLQKLDYNPAFLPAAKIRAVKEGKAGIIDFSGKVLVPFIYDDIQIKNEYYKIVLDNKTGLIRKDFTVMKKPVLKKMHDYSYALLAWLIEMPDGQKGYMDRDTGKIYIPDSTE